MAKITGNTCSVVTIFPLTVECNPTNASTNISTDGSIELYVNGGTAPYSITWQNGQHGQNLNNLSAGTYTATVVDYYGDYTATTECEVGYDSFFLSKLDNCKTGTPIYLTGYTFDNNIYTFGEIEGCYEFDTTVLYTSQSYSSLTVNNIYDTCLECQGPDPTPVAEIDMCLSNDASGEGVQYTFTTVSVDVNGNFVWQSGLMTLQYNTNGYWEITPWLPGGTMRLYQSPASNYPLGLWTNSNGTFTYTWSMDEGVCTTLPISLSANPTDPNCAGETGTVNLTAQGGTPPYQYSIQGITPLQSTGLFTNLSTGTYTGLVQDNNGDTANTTFTINVGGSGQLYTVSLTRGNISTTNNTVNNSLTKSYNYNVNISPSLPAGLTVSFNIRVNHSREKYGKQPNSNSVTFSDTFTVNKNGTPVSTNNSPVLGTLGRICGEYVGSISTYTTTTSTITMTGSDTVSGSLSTTVDLNTLGNDCSCKTGGDYDTTLSLMNVTIAGDNCSEVSGMIGNLPMEVVKEDCIVVSNCYTYRAVNTGTGVGTVLYTNCSDIEDAQPVNGGATIAFCARPTPAPYVGVGQVTITQISTLCS